MQFLYYARFSEQLIVVYRDHLLLNCRSLYNINCIFAIFALINIILFEMTSSPPKGSIFVCVSCLLSLEPLEPVVRCQLPTVQSQSKPVHPSYHLESTIPLPSKPRPTDQYRPLNILRSSSRPIVIRLPAQLHEIPPSNSSDARTVRTMEEFIAVVFDNEVWMGLVDFKSEKPLSEENVEDAFGKASLITIDLVRDLRRSSGIIVPRTFRTPHVSMSPRVQSPLQEEEGECERRVEFDVSGNAWREEPVRKVTHRATSPPGGPGGLWSRRGIAREKDGRDTSRDKARKDDGKEGDRKEKERWDKDAQGRKEPLKEIRKGLPPPTAVLHGYKHPVRQPKSILKRTETRSVQQVQAAGIFKYIYI